MKKQWSISTTVRNAERIRNFLIVINEMNGEEWNPDNEIKYQILLIQNRFYGLTSQFFNGLSVKQVKLLKSKKEISYQEAKEIFETKKYEDPSIRGRVSISPLKKMGLVNIIDKKVQITSLGEYLLQEDYHLGIIFFRIFIKWQLPNLDSREFRENDGFCIKPFVGTLHLINKVNQKWEALGNKSKGISKDEFNLFVPTLINYQDIEVQAQRIIDLRKKCEEKKPQEKKEIIEKYKYTFARQLMPMASNDEIDKFINNLKDYGDNTRRYFRLTGFLYIRGGGYYVDLEYRREVEISSLLSSDNASPQSFSTKEEYQKYISDINKPILPWESDTSLRKIAKKIITDLKDYESKFKKKHISMPSVEYKKIEQMNGDDLKGYIEELREKRRKFQEMEIRLEAQDISQVQIYITELKNIHKSKEKKSVELERLVTLALNALNDALDIKPNYPVGDDNKPTFTAPANKADIECFYSNFNAVCEVTMLNGRDQWYNEGQPVMRHVRDFENKYQKKDVYCLFVAPKLHQDTVETFWMSVTYAFKGKKQKIVPITISQLINILETLVKLKKQGKSFTRDDLMVLYDKIIALTDNVEHSDEWVECIPDAIRQWEEKLLCQV